MLILLPIVAIAAFFIGSLPLARWLTAALTLGGRYSDARYVALIRVFTDIFKGAIAVAIGHEAGIEGAQFSVLFVYLGHIFPLGAGFGQQNGTGTLLGALIILDSIIGLTALSSWMFAYYIYRHATFSALVSAVLTTTIFLFTTSNSDIRAELLILLTLIVVWRHRRHIHIRL